MVPNLMKRLPWYIKYSHTVLIKKNAAGTADVDYLTTFSHEGTYEIRVEDEIFGRL